MFVVKDKAKFLRDLNARLQQIRTEVNQVYRGWAIATFHRVAMETPQWTGNAASNWNLAINQPDYSVTYSLKLAAKDGRSGPPSAKGDARAAKLAARRAQSSGINAVTIRDTVYITNATENLNGSLYIQHLEEDTNNFLRSVNKPGHMLEYTRNTADSLGVLTPAQEKALQSLTLGQLHNPGVGI